MSDEPTVEAVETVEDASAVEATYGWGEYDCDRCGSSTDRVWWSGGDPICPGCTEW